jgi:sugar phosphate isomerase/epimerase
LAQHRKFPSALKCTPCAKHCKQIRNTVRAIAAMGYQGLEFYAPYFAGTVAQTKEMKKLLDELGVRCFSTHNDQSFLNHDKIQQAIDRNLILGSKYVVMASSAAKPGPAGWKEIAEQVNLAAEKLETVGLQAGYHNHQLEFTPVTKLAPIPWPGSAAIPAESAVFPSSSCRSFQLRIHRGVLGCLL